MAAHTILSWIIVLPAVALGYFCVAVLNVNNIRDMKTDAGIRVTTPLKVGLKRARIYQTVLIAAGWLSLIVFNLMRFPDIWHWLFMVTLPLFIKHLMGVWTRTDKDLDPMLPLLVMATFILSLLFGLGYLVFLF